MTNAPAVSIQRVHWLTLLKTRGVLVTYKATGFELTQLKVVLTRPGEDQVDVDENFAIESKQWDVLIDPATLIDSNQNQFEPVLGHQVVTTDGSIYRVQPGNGTRNCWRWSDGLHTWRRVHTVID